MDLNAAIHPLVFISRCLGLGPFVSTVDNTSKRPTYVTSRRALVYGLVWGAAILAFLFATVPLIFQDRPKRMAVIMETTSTLQATCGILVFAFSHLVCFANRRTVLKLLSTTRDVSDALGLTPGRYVTIRRVVVAQIGVVFVVEVISTGLLTAGWGLPLSISKAMTFTFICIAEVSNGVAELQFVDFVLLTYLLYKAFLSKLDTIPKKSTERGLHAYTPVCMTVVCNKLDGENTCREVATDVDDSFGGLDISGLHCSLHEISQAVGSLFGLQNVLFIGNDFCALLYGLYYVFDFWLGLSRPEDTSALWVAFVVFEGILRCCRLVVMVTSCSLVAAKAEEVAYTVSKLQTSAQDEQTRSQMRAFSSQLVHRKISFTACGFLPIDASLITAIVGGVTTYLVIIIQFQMMTPPASPSSSSSSSTPFAP